MNAIKVLCVDDSPDLSLLLQKRIDMQDDMRSVGRVHYVEELLDEVRRSEPDVVVLDLQMLGRDTLEFMRELHAAFPQVRALIYSGFDQEEPVARARDAGAWGYAPKRLDDEHLLLVIREVAAGRRCFPPSC